MTIKQLTKKLNQIPKDGAINRARRAEIMRMIFRLMEGQA